MPTVTKKSAEMLEAESVESGISCEFCQAEYESQSELASHLKTSKKCSQSKNSNTDCKGCGKKFKSKAGLSCHHRFATNACKP